MIHEELLAELNQAIKDFEIMVGEEPYYKALRAVVELHKPQHSIRGYRCVKCKKPFPCSTIQAIEQELN